MNDSQRQAVLDAIGLLTLHQNVDDLDEVHEYLSRVIDGSLEAAGSMTAGLVTVCGHLLAALRDQAGADPGEILQRIAAHYVQH